MVVVLFMFFQLPGQYRFLWSRFRVPREGDLKIALLFSLCMLIFLLLEILEYRKWDYRFDGGLIPRLLFGTRLITVGALMVLGRLGMGDPGLHFYLTLLVFYAFFAFPFPVSLSFSLVLISGIFLDELILDDAPHRTQISFFYSVHKTLVMILYYLFAYFWKKDRDANDENRKLVEDLKDSRIQLEEYARMVGETSALEERTRLARDNHDSVGHALTAIQIQISKAEAFQKINPEESREALVEARDTAREAMGDIRGSLTMLNDRHHRVSLREEIDPLVRRLESTGCSVEMNIRGEEEGFNYAVLMALYRILQEGVTNILRHAESRQVGLDLEFRGDEVLLRLEDDGKGFDPDSASDCREGHYGLEGLKNRVELVRGKLDISSEPGKGCAIEARLPRDPVNIIGGSHG
jgi:signal transduction histidine kinase